MKKILSVLLISILLVTLTACGSEEKVKESDSNKNDAGAMTQEDINDRIYDSAMELTSIWNDYVTNIRDYAATGKDSIGQELDIEFLIENFKIDYAKLSDTKEFVNSLDSEHEQFKNAYNKAMEQLDIIYNSAITETPKPNEELSYNQNIELFKQYFDVVYNYAIELAFE